MGLLDVHHWWYSYIFDVFRNHTFSKRRTSSGPQLYLKSQIDSRDQSLEEGVNNLLTKFNPQTNYLCLLLDYEEKGNYYEYNFGLNSRRNHFYEYGPSSYLSLRLYTRERSGSLVITNQQMQRALIAINSIKKKEGFQLMQELRGFFEHSEILEEGKLDYICLPLGFGYDPRKKKERED
ncbi:hypothetical protein HYU21_01635 [Candidatus Woesearchaeota archaeon]|nr:hypothetical protein [Candidatus Woesearchaeota archaeon]